LEDEIKDSTEAVEAFKKEHGRLPWDVSELISENRVVHRYDSKVLWLDRKYRKVDVAASEHVFRFSIAKRSLVPFVEYRKSGSVTNNVPR
jgi:hypothetical protein